MQVGNIAIKVYLGNVKIIKGYLGNTLCFDDTAIVRRKLYQRLENLDVKKTGLAGAGANGYAVFAGGGYDYAYQYSRVDAYNMKMLGLKTELTNLSTAKRGLAGTSINDFVIFAGGNYYSSGTKNNNQVEMYNMALLGTKTTLTGLSTSKNSFAGAGANGYAVFAGGYTGAYNGNNQVEAYNTNSSGAKSSLSVLTAGKYLSAGVGTINGYVIFAGGQLNSSSYSNLVEAYDMKSSGAKTTLPNLSVTKTNLVGGSVKGYAVFAGGHNGDYKQPQVEAYNMNLSGAKTTLMSLSSSRYSMGCANLNNRYIVIAGGGTGSVGYSNQVIAIDMESSGTQKVLTDLVQARRNLASAEADDYAVFAGGYGYSGSHTEQDQVEAYYVF